jgi:hypothetical protein
MPTITPKNIEIIEAVVTRVKVETAAIAKSSVTSRPFMF